MFCVNCGSEIQEGLKICSKCVKSPTNATIKGKDTKMDNYPLINLSSKLFYPIFEMGLWIFFIFVGGLGGLAGYFIGYSVSYRYAATGASLGVIIGFAVSFTCTIIVGGLISIFLKMNENIEKLERK